MRHFRPILALILFLLSGCASTAPVNKSADVYFKEGEELYASKNYEEAIAMWKKVKESYFSPELTTNAELKIADAQFENGNYIEAAAAYEDFRKLHPSHDQAMYALYRLGLSHYQQIGGVDTDQTSVKNAIASFENYLRQYPNSKYSEEVLEKLDVCKSKQAQHEIYVGRFYLRTEKYLAAIQRLTGVIEKFPKSPANDEALLYLAQAYMLSGEKAKGRDTLIRLTNEYPSSKFIEQGKKFMEKHY